MDLVAVKEFDPSAPKSAASNYIKLLLGTGGASHNSPSSHCCYWQNLKLNKPTLYVDEALYEIIPRLDN